MRTLTSFALTLAALLSACATEPDQGAIAARSPVLGKADSGDRADRACQVVLRGVARNPGGDDYEFDCATGECLYVWRGSVEVAEDLPAEAGVHVLYHQSGDPTWWQVDARWEPTGQPGYRRYAFALSEHLWGPGGGHGPGQSIELVAFVRLPGGQRLFDHNRFTHDFDNHWLSPETYFGTHDGGVCQPTVGTLDFQDNWDEVARGARRQGGYLTLRYDLDRLTQCRGTHNGYPAWDITAFVKFFPGGELFSGSVRALMNDQGQPVNQGVELPYTLKIPAGAEAVEIWFRNHTGAGSGCEAWDSNEGQNYRFEVWPAADHPRCLDVELETGIRTESELMAHNAPACLGYELADQLDAGRCEFHVDGFGHGHMGHYGIPVDWLVTFLRIGALDGRVVNAGLYTRHHDRRTGLDGQRFSLGLEVEPGLWRAGFPFFVTGFQGVQPVDLEVLAFAFFVDLQRPSGEVVRLWHSRQGANYAWGDAFTLPVTPQSIPYGNVQWAHPDSVVLESRRACR
jgi:hypothetical protein